MPHRVESTAAAAGTAKASKVRKARQLLSGRGVSREDSDDELGEEDFGWEWTWGKAADSKERIITGARHGPIFRCRMGDTVLLKAEGSNEAWVGLICGFREDEESGEKQANFMWFSTEREIRNKLKKRTDFLSNELYISPAWDWNALETINGKATVLSKARFDATYPTGRVPRASTDAGKVFICRRGCNTRTATYTEEFVWEKIYHGPEDILALIDLVQGQTKATRRKRKRDPDEDDEVNEWKPIAEDPLTATPTKRRKIYNDIDKSTHGLQTPTRTPGSRKKYIVAKKPLEFTPLGTRVLSPSHTVSSPFQVARTRLHVATVPTALPCREEAFATVYSHLEAAISDGCGACIYISGTPGTGKTATVREAVAQLGLAVQAEELDDFIFVEINGMKVTEPHQSYSLLWEALRGDRVSPYHALDLLEREFTHPNPRRVPCVVLMDELDQLVTKNQSVMYNFFNWPSLPNSRLIVLAVANTMDLPERTLSNKISSRLGLTRITFPGYNHDQLMKIIESRLQGVPGNIVHPDAIQFASRKVAAVSGDARRALDICRRAVEIAENQAAPEGPDATPSKKQTAKDKTDAATTGRVTIQTIKQAINEATSTPVQQHLRSLPLASKLFLAATLARTRRSGIAECVLGDIVDEATKLTQMSGDPTVAGSFLRVSPASQAGANPADAMVPRILGQGPAVKELAEAGVLSMEARRGERMGKVRLNISEDEVRLAFKDDPEMRSLYAV